MTVNTASEEPCLVQAGQGFSVSYKQKFLYSKYAPDKAIEGIIQNTKILPESLIIINSPCLWYGLSSLAKSIDDSCFIIAVEHDKALFSLSEEKLEDEPFKDKVVLLPQENLSGSLYSLTEALCTSKKITINSTEFPKRGTFRRVIRFDFSAGIQFNRDFYNHFFDTLQNAISTFWKNRITLVKLGRLYSKNLLKNLRLLENSIPLENVLRTITKPILIFGAGESIEQTIADLQALGITESGASQNPDAFSHQAASKYPARDAFYILACDAALLPLLEAGIIPDAVIGMESQIAIEKAYIGKDRLIGRLNAPYTCAERGGKTEKKIHFFSDLTGRPEVASLFDKKTFFFTEYDTNDFTLRLKASGILPAVFPPLGSVGLSALYLALLIRTDARVPVLVSGLDFSYSCGKTHARGTAHQNARVIFNSRLNPVENYGACFGGQSVLLSGKDGNKVWSTKNLFMYRELFEKAFKDSENVFDIGSTGLPLGIRQKDARTALAECRADCNMPLDNGRRPDCDKKCDVTMPRDSGSRPDSRTPSDCDNRRDCDNKCDIEKFLASEKDALVRLKSLLQEGEASPHHDRNNSLTDEIKQALTGKDYLYLHFPDGHKISTDTSFLKRVRSQLDFFIKYL